MKVTVGICTWNRSGHLQRTLEYFKRLRVPGSVSWELVVVDNNSTDSTQEVLTSFREQLPIRAFFEERQGQSFARNTAIREARGELLLWTDDDVRPDEAWLEETCRAFDVHDADLVFGRILPLWLTAEPAWFSERLNGKFALVDHGPEPFVATELKHMFFGANHAGRTEVFRSLGGYRVDLGLIGESGGEDDTELFVRALDAKLRIVYEPKSLIWHMIDGVRCTKAYHRRRTWKSSASSLRTMGAESAAPRIMNLPRYLYRLALEELLAYGKALLKGEGSERFYRELRLIMYAGVFWKALRSRVHK